MADFCNKWSKELGSAQCEAMLNLNNAAGSEKTLETLAQFTKEKDELEKAIDARVKELQANKHLFMESIVI